MPTPYTHPVRNVPATLQGSITRDDGPADHHESSPGRSLGINEQPSTSGRARGSDGRCVLLELEEELLLVVRRCKLNTTARPWAFKSA